MSLFYSYIQYKLLQSPPPPEPKTSQIINHENFLRLKRHDLLYKGRIHISHEWTMTQ